LARSAGRSIAWTAAVLALASCSSPRHGFPPFWEHEDGLPGRLSEDRAVFGIASRTYSPDGARLSALRPLLAKVEDGKGREKLHVVPPFGSHTEDPKTKSTTTLWPLFFDSSSGDEKDRAAEKTDDDTWLFPLLAWGDEPGEGSYFAFFPVYGTLKGKLLADRIDFVLFPIHARTQADDWRSTHVLWPLIAWGESKTRSHFRVMPFWSQSDSPNQSQRTLLWPVGHWGWQKRGDRTFDEWAVWPLYGRRDSRDGTYRSWTALFPFFEGSTDAKNGDEHLSAPWPFYRRVHRPGVAESTWYWPFYGWYESETERSSFYAWPIVWSSDRVEGKREFRQRFVVPLWMKRTSGPVKGEPDEGELRSWPLFSWRRRADGYESVRVPEIVPFFGWEAGETCYADLVALFRWSADRDGREAWDGPLGAIRYRENAEGGKTLTLLWWIDIPLGGGK
jgi:hypothetical protein